MTDYNNKLILGRATMLLDNVQRDYLAFEENTLKEKFITYLNKAKREAEIQYFLESNPMFIPGLYDCHNGPLGNVIISKLQLGNEFITDFAFISVNSAKSQITLIEIESPSMKVFRDSDDQFTSEFNKAHQQICDWGLWSEQNATYLKDTFRNIYFKNVFRFQKVVTRRILVAGRRTEIQKNTKREKRWASVNQDPSSIVMSYDRLEEIFFLNPRLLQNLICRPARYISDILKTR